MSSSSSMDTACVGILPAGGWARRIAPLPCSKEIYPIGLHPDGTTDERARVVCDHVLERMQQAGIKTVYWALRKGKWDIPAYLGNGETHGLHLAYLVVPTPQYGPAYSVAEAMPFVQGALVALGFPDCLFAPDDAFAQLRTRQQVTEAELVLGLFPVPAHPSFALVDVDDDDNVHSVLHGPSQRSFRYTWIMAVWTPAFSRFFHDYVRADAVQREQGEEGGRPELVIGEVVEAAIQDGLSVNAVRFPNGSFLDIGTPDNLARARQWGKE